MEGGTTPNARFEVRIFADTEELADGAARCFGEAIEDAVQRRGRCTFALSRPSRSGVFRRLARSRVPWDDVDLFQVDERVAPAGSNERNVTLIERELRSVVPGSAPRMHPMPVELDDLDKAARLYEEELVATCSTPPVLDVVHLGLGADGHTASLVPGDVVLEVRDRWVAATQPYEGCRRVTLTYPTLHAARMVVVLAVGAEKATALRRVLDGDGSAPAARLDPANVTFLVDEAAAGR